MSRTLWARFSAPGHSGSHHMHCSGVVWTLLNGRSEEETAWLACDREDGLMISPREAILLTFFARTFFPFCPGHEQGSGEDGLCHHEDPGAGF